MIAGRSKGRKTLPDVKIYPSIRAKMACILSLVIERPP
jgi:hypothetical protein